MEKEIGQIKYSEIDGGLKIEITGEKFKDMFACCLPLFGSRLSACCTGEESKAECCPDEKKK
jgi:hypothetical protein